MDPIRVAAAFTAALLLTALPTEQASADMMGACAPEISNFCGDVSKGRGRITACLFSNEDRLGSTCGPAFEAVAKSGSENRLVPSGVRSVLAGTANPDVPAVCNSDISRFCPSVENQGGRELACLYAHMDKVTPDCATKAKSMLI